MLFAKVIFLSLFSQVVLLFAQVCIKCLISVLHKLFSHLHKLLCCSISVCVCFYGQMNSWMLLISCFPTMMTSSSWASSIRHPPAPHCDTQTEMKTKSFNYDVVPLIYKTTNDALWVHSSNYSFLLCRRLEKNKNWIYIIIIFIFFIILLKY